MSKISFEGKITFPIYYESQQLHMGWKRFLPYILPLFVFISPVFQLLDTAPEYAKVLITINLAVVLFFYFINKSRIKKVYNQTPELQYPISGEISGDGFKISNQVGNAIIDWNDITNYKFNDKIIILYRGPCLMNILANSFFSSSQELDLAKQVITKNIRSNNRLVTDTIPKF